MADTEHTIGSDVGDDHSTISAWESATDVNLAGTGNRYIGLLRGEEHVLTGITFTGGTRDATGHRCLRTIVGQEFDHTDKTGTVARIDSATTGQALLIDEDFFEFGGSDGSSSGSIGVSHDNTGTVYRNTILLGEPDITCSQIILYDCVCSSTGSLNGFAGSSADLTCYNCLVYNCDSSSGTFNAFNSSTLTCYNCVAYDITGGTGTRGFASCACYNCYAGACSTEPFRSNCTGDYNAADDTSSSIFTNNLQSKAGGSQFVSVTSSSEDFHLKAGADLIDAGNDAYSNEFDINGAVAGARDDMGCHEYVAVAGGGHPTMRRWGGIPGMSLTGRVNW